MKVHSLLGVRGVGSVGELTIQNWKDVTVARTKPVTVANPKTEAQQVQRSKFTLINSLSRQISSVITLGFSMMATSMTQFNSFMKYNITTAIAGTYPAFEIDWSKLIVSRGSALPLTGWETAVLLNGNVEVFLLSPAGAPVPADSEVFLVYMDKTTKELLYFGSQNLGLGHVSFVGAGQYFGDANIAGYGFYKNSVTGAISDSVYLD